MADQFMVATSPYYVQLFNKEESFFKELDKVDPMLVNNETIEGDEDGSTYMSKFLIFKSIWNDMPEDRRAYVWKMFIALVKVGAVASNNPDHKQILSYVDTHPELFGDTHNE